MRSIYAKASTVVVWLGESPAIENILRHCNKSCGPSEEILACSRHMEELWKSILDYTWFRRTWVRQEVFAAARLNVCSPYFSTTWEHFTGTLHTTSNPNHPSSHEAVQNLNSLNELYSSRRLKLLDLLKQGRGFQASVPHDHVFSVLGMMSTPKHSTKGSFPVTYNKTYDEVRGDVTRFIIRESQSISILKLCPLQKDRSYAFNWPAVEVSCPVLGEVKPEICCDRGSEFLEWFELENPIREVSASMPSENTASSSISGQSVSTRPLVLYGRAWGTLMCQLGKVKFRHSGRFKVVSTYLVDYTTDEDTRTESSSQEDIDKYREFVLGHNKRFKSVSTNSVDCTTNKNPRIESSSQEDIDEYREFLLYDYGLRRYVLGGISKEYESRVIWECRGNVREGDIFVSLEPDPCNVVLRKCPRLGDLFEVVGWGNRMSETKWVDRSEKIERSDSMELTRSIYQRTRPVKEWMMQDEIWAKEEWRPDHAPGPRKRFRIR
jgi:hypothetical protein